MSIHRTPLYKGTKRDFEMTIEGMSPISGIPGINESSVSWWVHPTTCAILHLISIEDRTPYEALYIWTKTDFDANSTSGFNRGGFKIVKLGGKAIPLHRIIAYTFITNTDPKTKTIVYHINGNRRDNRAVNLRWVSPKELRAYRKRMPLTLKFHLKPKKANEGY